MGESMVNVFSKRSGSTNDRQGAESRYEGKNCLTCVQMAPPGFRARCIASKKGCATPQQLFIINTTSACLSVSPHPITTEHRYSAKLNTRGTRYHSCNAHDGCLTRQQYLGTCNAHVHAKFGHNPFTN